MADTLGLPPAEARFDLGFPLECFAAPSPSPTSGAAVTVEGCVIVVHTAFGDFASRLDFLLNFGGPDIARVELWLDDVNDDEPLAQDVDGNKVDVQMGINTAGPKKIRQVKVTTTSGQEIDVTGEAKALFGETINVTFPQAGVLAGTCPAR
jgi:hypothetical protein